MTKRRENEPAKDAADKPLDPATLSYEQAVEALESIVERIEGGEIGLEESLEAYRGATELLKRCRSILEVTEQRMETISAEDDETEPAP